MLLHFTFVLCNFRTCCNVARLAARLVVQQIHMTYRSTGADPEKIEEGFTGWDQGTYNISVFV